MAASLAKAEILALVSHELLTPLNAIIGFSEALQAELLGPLGAPAYKAYAAHIHDSGVHLLGLIRNLLDAADLHAGRLALQLELLDASAVLKACVESMSRTAQGKGLRLVVNVPPGQPHVQADPVRLEQMVRHLLSNAIACTPAGGTVAAYVEVDVCGAVSLIVRDSGVGMTVAELDRSLRPFEQSEEVYARAGGGLGLGLPLVRGLADLHGATLAIRSSKGRGTTARIRFPSVPQAEEAIASR